MELKQKLIDLIAASGPITVADYMAVCLLDPQHGYYTTNQPFGARGDFITAPEISQMFGELVGIWLYSAFEALGRPVPVTVAELGPGRGTLFADMVRTFNSIDRSFATKATFVLIEPSPPSRSRSARRPGGGRCRRNLAGFRIGAPRRKTDAFCRQ